MYLKRFRFKHFFEKLNYFKMLQLMFSKAESWRISFWIFKNFSQKFGSVMIAARRRKFSNSRLKIFWFFTFWRKKIAEVFRLQTIYYVRPLMQNNISWRPQNKWGPPGLARWRWDLVHVREFFRIFGKILATFLGAKRPGRHKLGTSAEQDRSHRVRCFEKKVTDP